MNPKKYFQRSAILLSLILISPLSFSLDSDLYKSVTIDADNATSNGVSETTVYQGNVLVTQGSLKLKADTVTLKLKDSKLVTIIAKGTPATLSQLPRVNESIVTASAKIITYNIKQQNALLEINAKLQQDGRKLSSNRITYDFNKKLVKANSTTTNTKNERVRVVIPPAN